MSTPGLWKRYQQYLCQVPSLGLTLDVSRMRFQDLRRDLAILDGGRTLSLAIPRPLTPDFWSCLHDPVVFALTPVPGAKDAYTLTRQENGKGRTIGGCLLKSLYFRIIPPGEISALQAYLEVTMVGLGAVGSKTTYTGSVLVPLTLMVVPQPYPLSVRRN